jgi:hypothetical protein
MASVNPWSPQPTSNVYAPPGGGSNFGQSAGNPLGQQSFWEQMSVFPDGTPRPNTAFGNAVSGGYTGSWQDFHNGGGQSSPQSGGSTPQRPGAGNGGATSGGQSQGWSPQPGTVSSGGDYRQQLMQMIAGTNNNLNQAFGGAGGGGGRSGWQHNYQPAYFPYANNSGLGFGGGTAGMFLRPQEYIPGTQTTWAGDLPQYQAETSADFDRDHLAQIRMDQEIARANGKAKVEAKRADQAAYQAAIGRQPDDWKNVVGTYKERRDAILAENKRRREAVQGPSRMGILRNK